MRMSRRGGGGGGGGRGGGGGGGGPRGGGGGRRGGRWGGGPRARGRAPPRRRLGWRDEARAFVADYEAARGRVFGADERRLCAAAFAYSCGYTARCGWAIAGDERGKSGTFQALVASHGARLLEL